MKAEKMLKNEPSMNSMHQMVLEISHSWKSGIWKRWKSPFWKFWVSFSHKYDITDTILQDNEKVKVQYLRSLLFDLYEILQAFRIWHRNFTWFQISLLWQWESTQSSIIENTKGVLFKQKCCFFSKNNLKQYSWIIITTHSIIFLNKNWLNTSLILRKQ